MTPFLGIDVAILDKNTGKEITGALPAHDFRMLAIKNHGQGSCEHSGETINVILTLILSPIITIIFLAMVLTAIKMVITGFRGD